MSKYKLEEAMDKTGKIVSTIVGNSMMPMLRNRRDTVVLIKASGRLQERDVALFKRANGDYVLHRVVEVTDRDYVFLGDNQYSKEYGITDAMIIGKLGGFYRGEKYIDCKSKRYQFYVKLWCGTFVVRRVFVLTCRNAKRIFHKYYKNYKKDKRI